MYAHTEHELTFIREAIEHYENEERPEYRAAQVQSERDTYARLLSQLKNSYYRAHPDMFGYNSAPFALLWARVARAFLRHVAN